LAAALIFGDTISLGTQDARLFGRVAALYLLAAIGFLVSLLRDPRYFNLQLSVQVAADILALTVMMFASGGQKSGIAVLLLVVVAGAGLVGQGRMTLFYAALASVAMLLEESWRALTREADPADFVRTGMICIAFFGTAIIARLLARRVVTNETWPASVAGSLMNSCGSANGSFATWMMASWWSMPMAMFACRIREPERCWIRGASEGQGLAALSPTAWRNVFGIGSNNRSKWWKCCAGRPDAICACATCLRRDPAGMR
jgi:hypothetical protein